MFVAFVFVVVSVEEGYTVCLIEKGGGGGGRKKRGGDR